jgi:hypothetical protein
MYVQHTVGGFRADREAVAVFLGLSVETVRKRVPVVGRLPSGVALHDLEQAALLLADVKGRRRASA